MKYYAFLLTDPHVGKQDFSFSQNGTESPFLVQLRQIVKKKLKRVTTTTAVSVEEYTTEFETKLRHDFKKLKIMGHQKFNEKRRHGRAIVKDHMLKTYSRQKIIDPKDAEPDKLDESESKAKKLRRLRAKLHLKCILNDMMNAFKQIKRNSTDGVSNTLLNHEAKSLPALIMY